MKTFTKEEINNIAKKFNKHLNDSIPMLTEKLSKGFDALAEQDITSKDYEITVSNIKETVELLSYNAKVVSMTEPKNSNTIKFNKEKK